ncbi:hypothetical protein HEP84_10555 [Streptomyces sp. RLB1-33]|uniref:hypothetical protein n=1 Tax=Streptomyces mirabilis TaxID=68239 RepID=UPI001B3C8E0C|nr:hypothetical protein SMIR_34215 [Streptomyces mirabilis]
MVRTARELLEDATAKLAPDPHANRLLPLIARGAAQRSTLAALALEQRHVVAADRRAFLHLAERPDVEPQSAAFFALFAEGEALAQDRLGAFADACGVDEARAAACEPLADCRTVAPRSILRCGEVGHPARVAW